MDEPPPRLTREQLDERLQEARRRNARRATARRKDKVRKAANWVLAVAILQFAFGLITAFNTKAADDRALAKLARYDDDELVELEGDSEPRTAAEVRIAVERERVQAFVVPLGLAAVFLALYFWARGSPLPALCSALALFVTTHAITAVVDPKQIARGVAMKVFVIVGLAGGIKSALQERAAQSSKAPLAGA